MYYWVNPPASACGQGNYIINLLVFCLHVINYPIKHDLDDENKDKLLLVLI